MMVTGLCTCVIRIRAWERRYLFNAHTTDRTFCAELVGEARSHGPVEDGIGCRHVYVCVVWFVTASMLPRVYSTMIDDKRSTMIILADLANDKIYV